MLSLYLCGFPLGDPVFSYSRKSIALIGDPKLPVGVNVRYTKWLKIYSAM